MMPPPAHLPRVRCSARQVQKAPPAPPPQAVHKTRTGPQPPATPLPASARARPATHTTRPMAAWCECDRLGGVEHCVRLCSGSLPFCLLRYPGCSPVASEQHALQLTLDATLPVLWPAVRHRHDSSQPGWRRRHKMRELAVRIAPLPSSALPSSISLECRWVQTPASCTLRFRLLPVLQCPNSNTIAGCATYNADCTCNTCEPGWARLPPTGTITTCVSSPARLPAFN